MTHATQNRDQLAANLSDLLALLAAGQFLEAQEKYLAEDVVLQEGDDPAKAGKAEVMEAEAKVLADVAEFRGYRVSSSAIGEDKTFYEGVMEFVTKGGEVVRVEQAVVDTWRDGKIVHERFYHA